MLKKALFTICCVLAVIVFVPKANAFWGIFGSNKSQAPQASKGLVEKEPGDLRFAFVSDAYLYPVPTAREHFTKAPKSKVGIMYVETQVLLQELVRDFIDRQANDKLDFVLFGGSQVANNLHWNLFLDIMDELTKNDLDYYYMIGEGEYNGPNNVDEVAKQKYWHRMFNGVHFLVFDNSKDFIYLKQIEWLKKKIKELENSIGDVFVFSYKPLNEQIRSVVERIPNLKLIANSYDLKYQISYPTNDRDDKHRLNLYQSYVSLTNPSLAVYPCAYTVITRKANGEVIVQPFTTSLKGVQSEAEKELRSIGKDPRVYKL